jgi:pilus assembly protein CpaB
MHNRRALLFFAFAVVLGTAAAFLAQRTLENQAQTQIVAPAAKVETVKVVLARTDVTVGSALSSQQLRTVEWPKDYAPRGAFADEDELVGRVLRRALADGEPILEPSLLPEGSEAGLVSVINSEARAVSVKVDPIIGVAGFVNPGTRVDVLATLRNLATRDKVPYTKVVLQDVRVLAIDQKMEEAQNGEPELVSVVTLEVTPLEAEKLAYSAHEGRLQLALRGPGDHTLVQTIGVSAGDMLARPRRQAIRKAGVQIVKGSDVSVKSY